MPVPVAVLASVHAGHTGWPPLAPVASPSHLHNVDTVDISVDIRVDICADKCVDINRTNTYSELFLILNS